MFAPSIRQLSGMVPSGMSRHELVDLVEGLRRLQGATAATEARVVMAIESLDDGGLDGSGVLRVAGRKSGRVAARISAAAEMLVEMPLTAAALESGDITWSHAAAIATAAEKVSPALADAGLAGRAARCPADVFSKDCREWVARNLPDPPDDPDESADRQRADRSITDWTGRDGMSNIHIKLPPADALMGMVRSGGAGSASPRHPKHQLTVIADITRLRLDNPAGMAQIIGSGASVPQSLLERLACNSTITAMLFDGPGRPLFVGRSHRSATTAQWLALIARDGGCVGCGADPNRCEAHHVQPWQVNGATDITNLVLLCSRCHHDVHDRGVELVSSDGRWQTRLGPPPAHPPDLRRRSSTSRSRPATREPFTRTTVPGGSPPVRASSSAMASPMSAVS